MAKSKEAAPVLADDPLPAEELRAGPPEARPALIERLQAAHRAAEKARDHHGAAALNGVLVALGDARHKACTALAAVDETLDGRILKEAEAMVPEVREVLRTIAEL